MTDTVQEFMFWAETQAKHKQIVPHILASCHFPQLRSESIKDEYSTYDGIDKKSPTLMLHLHANENILTSTNLPSQYT